MKLLLAVFTSILALNVTASSLMADVQPNIPASAWEHHAEGVSVALFLTSRTENGGKKSAIKVFIKNSADTKMYLPGDVNDSSVQIFYVDANGNHIPLRDYTPRPPSVVSMPAMPDSRRYEPGEVGIKSIDITPAELALVEAHLVFCRLRISSQEVGGYKLVESSPKMLTTIANQ